MKNAAAQAQKIGDALVTPATTALRDSADQDRARAAERMENASRESRVDRFKTRVAELDERFKAGDIPREVDNEALAELRQTLQTRGDLGGDRTQAEAKRQGYVWMDGKQRKRRLPDAKRKVRGYVPEVSRALRQGPNAVIQGTSAIQAKTTIVAAHEFVQRKGWRLWATVHDELLVLAPEDFTQDDLAEFERIMVETYRFGDVTNKTDIEVMTRWGEGMTPDEWFAERGEQ